MSDVPDSLRYTKEHEWVRIEDDGSVVIGITAHAVEQLGDITMVTLPEEGGSLEKDQAFGDVDSVKAVSELFAPMDATVVSVNADLDADPEAVNEDPYGRGWMLKVTPSDKAQLEGLLSADDYRKILEEAD